MESKRIWDGQNTRAFAWPEPNRKLLSSGPNQDEVWRYSNNIRKETYKKFEERVKKTMYEGIQQETIENLVASMPKR